MSTTTRTPIRSWDLVTRDCDTNQLVRDIGVDAMMRTGARDLIRLQNGGLQMTVSRGQKLIVQLGADDLFTVERVRKIRGSLDWTSEAFTDRVHVERISAVVIELGDVE